MKPNLPQKCEECENLHSGYEARYSEYVALRDELAMASKGDAGYNEKARDFKAATGRLREARKRIHAHKDRQHSISN